MAPDGKTAARNTDAAGGKKRKRYLPHNKPVKKKGSYPLRPGVQGFFITCDGGREHQASREALNILESFYEDLVHGEDSSAKELPKRPLNTKITFADSDEEDDDDDDDDDDVEDKEEEEVQEGDEEKGEKKHKTNASNDEDKAEEVQVGDEEKGDMTHKTDASNDDNAGHYNGAGEKSDTPKIDDLPAEEAVDKANNKGDVDNKADEQPAMKQCCKTDVPACGLSDKVEHKSIDRLIEDELKELGDKNKRRFVKLDSGCNGVVFVQMRKKDGEKSPKDIVQQIVTSAASTRKHMSRFILRILPIEVSCYASKEEISKAMAPLVEQYFPAETENPHKFAVLYEARANTGVDRMKIIDAVAKSIPGPHKVDLSNPDKTIVVEIARTVCLIGVIEKYKEYSKYNLRQLTSRKI